MRTVYRISCIITELHVSANRVSVTSNPHLFAQTQCPGGFTDRGMNPNGQVCTRGWSATCTEDCAKAACEAGGGIWAGLNPNSNPYTCYMPKDAKNVVATYLTSVDEAKDKLAKMFPGNPHGPSRMVVEVKDGQVQKDPHQVGGRSQSQSNGFHNWWSDWNDINGMVAVAQAFVDTHDSIAKPTKTGKDQASGSLYELYDARTYDDALKLAEQLPRQCDGKQGHLVTIGSSQENEFVQKFAASEMIWMGMTDIAQEGNFEWVTGEPTTFSNWNAGEPNDWGGIEDHAMMIDTGKWNDSPGSSTYKVVVEYDCPLAKPSKTGKDQASGSPLDGFIMFGPEETSVVKNWNEADEFCKRKASSLATLEEYCHNGPIPVFGVQGADEWAPIQDYRNGWVQVGAKSAHKTCATHRDIAGDPAWGANNSKEKYEANYILCKKRPLKGTTKFSFLIVSKQAEDNRVVPSLRVVHTFTDLDAAKKKLASTFPGNPAPPIRMIVEVENDEKVMKGFQSLENKFQTFGNGFHSYWKDWAEMRKMQAVAQKFIDDGGLLEKNGIRPIGKKTGKKSCSDPTNGNCWLGGLSFGLGIGVHDRRKVLEFIPMCSISLTGRWECSIKGGFKPLKAIATAIHGGGNYRGSRLEKSGIQAIQDLWRKDALKNAKSKVKSIFSFQDLWQDAFTSTGFGYATFEFAFTFDVIQLSKNGGGRRELGSVVVDTSLNKTAMADFPNMLANMKKPPLFPFPLVDDGFTSSNLLFEEPDYDEEEDKSPESSVLTMSETCGTIAYKQKDYRGTVNTTKSGEPCQSWSSQSPHGHMFTPESHSSDDLERNFCRNPDGSDMAWCYTSNPDILWGVCDVPAC